MSEPDLLERVRMCLAEVGENPERVYLHPSGAVACREGDPRLFWRAFVLSLTPAQREQMMCFACYSAMEPPSCPSDQQATSDKCRASLPLTEDCGVDR
jgi:hypothetical protein